MLHNTDGFDAAVLGVMAGVSEEPLNMCPANNGDRFEKEIKNTSLRMAASALPSFLTLPN